MRNVFVSYAHRLDQETADDFRKKLVMKEARLKKELF